jgi:hypothetical protein
VGEALLLPERVGVGCEENYTARARESGSGRKREAGSVWTKALDCDAGQSGLVRELGLGELVVVRKRWCCRRRAKLFEVRPARRLAKNVPYKGS